MFRKEDAKVTRRAALLGGVGAAGLAAAACSSGPRVDRFEPATATGPFRHGVASGDPDQTSVMLWTALTQDGGGYRGVEVARDEAFQDIVFEQGESLEYIQPQPLGTLKILADGLTPGERYFYRFRLGSTYSPTGVTRTLPEGRVDRFTIAAFSCANFPAGHFNAYRDAAGQGDVDLCLHLGDYFYEYGAGGYGTGEAEAMNRLPDPRHETLSYLDYVRRHALYKSDPDLQAAHAAAPWIMVWDDHETANDSWSGGAENHQPDSEGPWSERRDAALRAWYEWTPSREPDNPAHRWAAVEIGDLATLVMVESRLTARDEPFTWDDCPVDFSGRVNDAARAELADWMATVVDDPDRRLIGQEQLDFIANRCAASAAAGKPWRILANQVIMARVQSPNFDRTLPFWMKWYTRSAGVHDFVERSRYDIVWNFDAWDGYPAERRRLFSALKASGADILTLTGDTHNFWANDLVDEDGDRIGSELGVTSVSSPGAFDGRPGPDIGRLFEQANEDVLVNNVYDRGWVKLVLTPDQAEAEFVSMETVLERSDGREVKDRFRIRPAMGGPAPRIERI